MKNLKKVLSLGLALVMLLGMFTIASAAEDTKSASDLTDWNTVQHKDAVSLMVDLGIIKGMPDGSFAPTGNIDRASWAKMVYFAATGSEDADAYLGTATGLNDIAGNWAESYISFLKAGNYISGDNFGNYNPSANVTVAEACKMMLTILGYDAEDRAYQNTTAWAGNIMTDARRNGLLENVDSNMTALTPLTRENAAEIVLNALNANTVTAESRRDQGQSYVIKYTKGSTLGYDVFNMVKVTAIVDGITSDGKASISTVTYPEDFRCASNISGKVKASATIVGEEVNIYVRATGFKWDADNGELLNSEVYYHDWNYESIISTAAAKAKSTPAKVITGGFTMNDLTTPSSKNYVAPHFGDKCAYYYNGNKVDASYFGTSNIGKLGTVGEFYLDKNGDIGVMKVYYYTAEKVTKNVTTRTQNDGTLEVSVPGVFSGYISADNVNGWQDLEQDDIVLYYETNPSDKLTASKSERVYTIEKAEMITGKVTTHTLGKDAELTINGQKYALSGQNLKYSDTVIADPAFGRWSTDHSLADEFNFWLDKNGSIVVAQQVTESMDKSKVCLVIETEVVDSALGSSGSLAANLLFVDGSTEIVNVSKVFDADANIMKSVVDKLSTSESSAERQILTKDAQEAIAGTKDRDALKKFFNYRATSTGYELTELSAKVNGGRDWENVVTDTKASIMKEGKFAKVEGKTDTVLPGMLTANLSTTFIIGKVDPSDNTVTYSVANGFRELHEMDTTKITAIAANADPLEPGKTSTVAKYVYLETGAFKDDAPDGYVFIVDNDASVDPELSDDGVYTVNIVDTDGTAGTMRVTSDLMSQLLGDTEKNTLDSNPQLLRHFFQILTIDENRVVSALANGEATPTSGRPVTMRNVTAMGEGVVEFDNGAATCDYDDATKFVYVDLTWADGKDATNKIGVREPNLDRWVLAESGTFDPKGFYDPADVDDTGATSADPEAQNPKSATYISVKGCAIVPQNSTTADYVYVVRLLWD